MRRAAVSVPYELTPRISPQKASKQNCKCWQNVNLIDKLANAFVHIEIEAGKTAISSSAEWVCVVYTRDSCL